MQENRTGLDLCFFPPDCPDSYIRESEQNIADLRNSETIMFFVAYFIGLANNAVSIYVFKFRLLKNRLVGKILVLFFGGNIVSLTIDMLHLVITKVAHVDFGTSIIHVCLAMEFFKSFGEDFSTCVLCATPIIQMLIISWPIRFTKYRRNRTIGSKSVFLFSFTIALFTSLFNYILPKQKVCEFQGRAICLSEVHYLTKVMSFFPIVIVITTSLVIMCTLHTRKNSAVTFSAISSTIMRAVNYVIMSTSLLFVFSQLPMLFYIGYYRSTSDVECGEDVQTRFLLYAIAYFLQLQNNCLNCMLYVLLVPIYRQHVADCFCCRRIPETGVVVEEPVNSEESESSIRTIDTNNFASRPAVKSSVEVRINTTNGGGGGGGSKRSSFAK